MTSTRYDAYVYAYPHKTAYRPIVPPISLAELWADERRDALFLYVHVPFCEQRCGFCNLFTQPVPEADRVAAYVDALARQARVVRTAIDASGELGIARAAIGGGTPTLLDAAQLARVLEVMRGFGYRRGVPMSVETSPETALPDRLQVVVDGGADRISIGVQSFVEAECRAVNRPQREADVHRALRAIRDAGVATLNIDLMYGLPGQTVDSWQRTLDAALAYAPEELYLYPLYVRPLTTLGRKQRASAPEVDTRSELYDHARALLVERGYRQVSMRMFRHHKTDASAGPVYCCQDDGMIGLGPGARSYTRRVHYSSEWAVGARGVRNIIDRWITRGDDAFAVADYGFVLDQDEQSRRWLILSLLSDDGVDLAAYRRRFGAEPSALHELVRDGFAIVKGDTLQLTPSGFARADAIGPSLFSEEVRRRMASYELT